ncbi:hypothetical protein DS2_14914 [Catenovulum agarivorans DS-2]|uniref:Uncharacterized protein n=1 Tax=Catenovulum agarivorans DS-2 TaxID=1328313 RepID=W7QU56_9ALTE|nr:hypothetical protein [Catenovulum agarivorans]EWH08985.1 hypothetical protein DS2_14914 [Catenovulum agarivorans DS-2]
MYSSKPSIIYGFHGLDKTTALKILLQEDSFRHSTNKYDWLGSGIYFWENNLERAKQYAIQDSKRKNSSIKEPFVLAAVIELGNCLDLLDQKYNDFLKVAYTQLKQDLEAENIEIPTNKGFSSNDFDFKARELDCAVIRYACALAEEAGEPFDSVRAAFIEGAPLYEGARFYSENHIQLAIINPDCIKGIFLPREKQN